MLTKIQNKTLRRAVIAVLFVPVLVIDAAVNAAVAAYASVLYGYGKFAFYWRADDLG